MKKIIIACLLFLPVICQAHELKVLLTCDAPTVQVESYKIFVNGKPFVNALARSDGSLKKTIRLKNTGKYEFAAKACIGDTCSDLSESDTLEYSIYVRTKNKNNFTVIRYVHKYIER